MQFPLKLFVFLLLFFDNAWSSEKREVPILISSIKRGEVINSSNIYFSEFMVGNNVILDANMIFDKVAKTDIQKDRPIKYSQIKIPVLISKNSIVDVYYESKSVKIKSRAIALEDGYPEKSIKLKNLRSDKDFHGVVTSEGKVLVN